MDYFRAILKSGEKSQRALDLTTAVVDLNPANYAAWYVLSSPGASLAAAPCCAPLATHDAHAVVAMPPDVLLPRACARHTRRELLKALGADLEAELEFVGEKILESPKNYQVWSVSLPSRPGL